MQVADPEDGWTDFRPFHCDLWRHLDAAHNCIFLWSSATCGDAALGRICQAFGVERESVAVLQMGSDRPNVYLQRRITARALSIGWA
jgi:superfamily II DNA helicase RecQ